MRRCLLLYTRLRAQDACVPASTPFQLIFQVQTSARSNLDMPTTSRTPRDNSPRILGDGKSLSISVPQRKQPVSARGVTKPSNRAKTVMVLTRRDSKNNRISDRWAMLNKIIRGAKSTSPPSDESDLSDDGEEDCEYVLPREADKPEEPVYSRRVVHPTSPRFPSPLSGVEPVFRENVHRHCYAHRGLSYSALSHWRELWRKRKTEWDDYEYLLWQTGITTEEAYAGLAEDDRTKNQVLPAVMKSCPWKKTYSPKLPEKLALPTPLNPAVFPRLGDLSSTRDSFLISVDTWFSDFPLWTLHKLIWTYDINYRFIRRSDDVTRPSSKTVKPVLAEDFSSNGHLRVSSLSCLTENSDTTLVNTSTDELIEDADSLNNNAANKPDNSDIDKSTFPAKDYDLRPWETCWFNRWEILYHEVSLAADIAAGSETCLSSSNGSKEAARIIFTSPSLLHDPLITATCTENYICVELTPDSPSEVATAVVNQVLPVEDEDEDYGEVITPVDSRFRLGALLDPMSMFATADGLESDATADLDEEDSDFIFMAPSKVHNTKVADEISRLTQQMHLSAY